MTKKTQAAAKPSKFGKLLEQLLTVAAERAATIKLDESGNPIVTDADRAAIAEAGSDIVHRIVVGKAKQLLEEFESEDMADDVDELDDEIEGEELSDDIDAGADDIDPDFEGEELGPDAVAELRDKLMSGEEDGEMSDEDLDADDDMSDDDMSDEDMSDEDLDADADDFSDLSDDEDDGEFSAPDEDAVDDFKSKEGAFKA